MNQQSSANTDGGGAWGEASSGTNGVGEDVTNKLPASLWPEEQEGKEHGSAPRLPVGRASGDGLRMSEEDKKQAAMKTIAHLQEWAAKHRLADGKGTDGSSSSGSLDGLNRSGSMNSLQSAQDMYVSSSLGGQGYGGVGRAVSQHSTSVHSSQSARPAPSMHSMPPVQSARHVQSSRQVYPLHQVNVTWHDVAHHHHHQQQQQQSQFEHEYAAVLQRIIQDYLAGRQLSLVERQVLQQYLQMEQQKQLAQQQAQQREQEWAAQRLHREQLERMQMSRMQGGHALHDGGMAGRIGGGGHGLNGMHAMNPMARGYGSGDGMIGQRGPQGPAEMGRVGGLSSSGQLAGLPGGNVGPGSVGGSNQYHQQSFHRGDRNIHQNYNGNFNDHRPAGFPNQNGNGSYGRANHTPVSVSHDPGMPKAEDPIKTLQEIGRTLSALGITVEVAVNAGLLGGLSATDVRIVAEAHRLENELKGLHGGGNAAPAERAASLPATSGPTFDRKAFSANGAEDTVSRESSPPKSPRSMPSFGHASAPAPSSPAWSTGSLPNPVGTGSLPSGKMYGTIGGPGGKEGRQSGDAHGESEGGDQRKIEGNGGSMKSGGNGHGGTSVANDKSVSSGSVYTSTGDDQSYSATASGSASIVGDQQKDDDYGERELKGLREAVVGDSVENAETKISSYLDSLSLGTGW